MTRILNVLLAGLLFIMSNTASAAIKEVITIVNNSKDPVHFFFVKHTGTSKWSNDALGTNGVIPPGTSMDFTFDDSSTQCIYDFRIVTIGDNKNMGRKAVEQYEFNVCKNNSWSLNN